MYIKCDSPTPWGLFFQDSGSPQMEAIIELHNYIMYYLIAILFGVFWIMISIVKTYTKNHFSQVYLVHGTLIELIWTITPALILIFIAFPSFKLLYITDDITDPDITIKVEAHQWYWSYEYADFLDKDDEFISYDSYMINESELELGRLRQLEVDNRVVLPELSHIRFNVASTDVIHSLACPALGVKCDAYPYKSNQLSIYSNREGTYFGPYFGLNCSEPTVIYHQTAVNS